MKLKTVTSAMCLMMSVGACLASSHREAPFITELPKVDATDFYMFNSYESGRAGFVTIVANYQPFQTPYGGPNFFQMDPDALYQIHIDNNGDSREDITFSFRFNNVNRDIQIPVGDQMVSVPLYNVGAIPGSPPDAPTLNIQESYTLDVAVSYTHLTLPTNREV